MKSILLNIRSFYGKMGPGEKKIADFLIENPQVILPLSITQFAEKIGCGDATVVRFAKRVGVGGYQGLKLAIAQEISTRSDEKSQISETDSCYDMFTKRIHDINVALENTASVLDKTALENAAKAIMNSKRIVIFGLGNSASIAVDAQHKFLRVGLNASACNDNHMQAIIASHLGEDCVAIGISHSGYSTDIVQALKLSKMNNATTICVTNHGMSPILQVSDICLFTKSAETKHSLLAMSSRIAQLTIFDAIYTYIIANSDSDAVEAIHNTESALKDKKL
jgi:DNA-binding MurR/RpiR family transcriptional regulator